MCGGGGSSSPTTSTVNQVTIPPELMPYAKKLLGSSESLAYDQPYQTYEGQRMAGLNPMQQQAYQQIQQQQVSPQIGQATGMAGLAGLQSAELGRSYNPMQYNPMNVSYMGTQAPQLQDYQMSAPNDVQAQTNFGDVNAASLQQYQMGPAERVGADKFGSQAMQDYMSPYMGGVVEQQKRAAVQDYARQAPGMQAASTRSGARGGTRDALVQAEAQRGLQQQLGGIEATGRQQAYQQAAQQFGADRAAQMQAAQANQQAGLTTGQQNLASQLSTQQLGAQQGLQAQLANQQGRISGGQMGLQAALANQQSRLNTGQQNLAARLGIQQLGAQTGLQSQQLNQAAQLQAQQQGLSQNQFAQQLMEQSRQFGGNLGMQGYQQQLGAAQQLGQLGQNQFAQQTGINQAQMGAGNQLQQLEQGRLNASYEDFLNRQRYPYQQLGFMSDVIRGTPTGGGISSMYGAQTSPMGALAGLGGLYMAGQSK
jgi:hypothetical protein